MAKCSEDKYRILTVGNQFKMCGNPFRIDTYRGCSFGCKYCVDENTLITMYDGTTKKIKDVQIGDEIYGVSKAENGRRKYVKSKVLNKWEVEKPSYKITLENGIELICSANHRWLSDRGWDYTAVEYKQRPHLTTNRTLKGMGIKIDSSDFIETEDYMKGYLSGIILGDANLSKYDYSGKRREKDEYYRFCLALKDLEGIERTERYLKYFNLQAFRSECEMKDRKTGRMIKYPQIKNSSKEFYDKIKEIITFKNSKEFKRGYLAGFYDAEGSSDKKKKVVSNINDDYLNFFEECLKEFNFKYKYNNTKPTKNGILKSIMILGGVEEFFRFAIITNVAIKRKFNYEGLDIKHNNTLGNSLKIKSIEKFKDSQKLIDITTSTENFLANGVIAHNCFANSRNGKFGIINKLDKSLDVEWLEKQFEKAFVEEKEYKDITIEFLKHRTPLHMGGLSDPFQDREWDEKVTYDTIKVCNKYNYPIMFSTKVAHLPDEYWDILDNKIHAFQISLFTDDDEVCRKYETRTPLPSERIEFIKELHKRGFWVGLRIQPLIDLEQAKSLIEKVRDYVNYITVEHLKIAADNMVVRELFKNEFEALPFYKASGRNYELAYEFKENNIKEIKKVANGVPVGCGDNDLHHLTDSRCCCGIDTINNNFDNYLKYNQTYFLTGDCNKEELWTPKGNVKKCLNGDAVKKDMFLFSEYVDEYIDKFPDRMDKERKRGTKAYLEFLDKNK